MKLRYKLFATALLGIIPLWIGVGIIAGIGRASDRIKTERLFLEYTEIVTSQIESLL